MSKYNKGFTLVELAIVLVIIGLLLGGVLKGQEMIENGKIKNLQNDIKGVTAAYYAYRDRYNALPGDDPKALARWGTTTPAHMAVSTSTGDGVVGTVNTWTPCTTSTATTENCQFIQDLRLAGLITGQATPADPVNAYGGAIRVIQNDSTSTTAMLVGLNLCFGNLPAKAAEAVDAGFDDGDPARGNVRAIVNTTGNTTPVVAASTAYTDPNTYTVCKLL